MNKAIAAEALDKLDIDEKGLDSMDRELLTSLLTKHGGRAVGIKTLAAMLSEEEDTLSDVVEPYLLTLGFLSRTPRGRMATESAALHLGLPVPKAVKAA